MFAYAKTSLPSCTVPSVTKTLANALAVALTAFWNFSLPFNFCLSRLKCD